MSESDSIPHEIWKPVPGYEGLYEVSNLGRIKTLWTSYRLHPGSILKMQLDGLGGGYYRVRLTTLDHRLITCKVHRLVALAFLGPPPDEDHRHINHIDSNPRNNRPENLEWCSHRENMQHCARMGRRPSGDNHPSRLRPETVLRGSRCGTAKLSERDISPIRHLLRQSVPPKAIATIYGVDESTIRSIRKGTTWAHVPD